MRNNHAGKERSSSLASAPTKKSEFPLMQGLPDIANGLAKRNIGFVLRRYPDHKLLEFCEEVNPCLLIGDENPMLEPERWRQKVAAQTRIPFLSVDSDVIVPSKLLEKEQYGAHVPAPTFDQWAGRVAADIRSDFARKS
jgi:hypothetical protein